MSKEQKEKLEAAFDKLNHVAMTTMLAVILFFGKQVYSDIQQLKQDSMADKVSHSAQEQINKNLAERLNTIEARYR